MKVRKFAEHCGDIPDLIQQQLISLLLKRRTAFFGSVQNALNALVALNHLAQLIRACEFIKEIVVPTH